MSILIPGVIAEEEKLPPLSDSEQKAMKALGAELLPDGNIKMGDNLTIHRREKEVSFSGILNMREGLLEVVACTYKGRTHESLLVADIDPFKLQLALILLGGRNGPLKESAELPRGTLYDIEVQPEKGPRTLVEKWIFNSTKNRQKKEDGWIFIGSSFGPDNNCLATVDGNITNINSMDGSTILNMPPGADSVNDEFFALTEKIPEYRTEIYKGEKVLVCPITIFIKEKKTPQQSVTNPDPATPVKKEDSSPASDKVDKDKLGPAEKAEGADARPKS